MIFIIGTLIPQVKDVLLTDKSFKPFFTKFITSERLERGKNKFLIFFIKI